MILMAEEPDANSDSNVSIINNCIKLYMKLRMLAIGGFNIQSKLNKKLQKLMLTLLQEETM